jgi:hypothetical protein
MKGRPESPTAWLGLPRWTHVGRSRRGAWDRRTRTGHSTGIPQRVYMHRVSAPDACAAETLEAFPDPDVPTTGRDRFAQFRTVLQGWAALLAHLNHDRHLPTTDPPGPLPGVAGGAG